MQSVSLVWFRQDLRLHDNPALAEAIDTGHVLPVYILDDTNAGDWKIGSASRWWLHHSLQQLNQTLANKLWVYKGDPKQIIERLISEHSIENVFWNRCFEPWQVQRDKKIKNELEYLGISVRSFNSALLWEPWTNLKHDDTPYKVFTPFYENGMENLFIETPTETKIAKLKAIPCSQANDKIEQLALMPTLNWYEGIASNWSPGERGAQERLDSFIQKGIKNYKVGRDFPALNSVSRLSPHLHYGEISPRQILHCIAKATQGMQVEANVAHFQRELAWREFSYSLLYYFPFITHRNLNQKFDQFPWVENEALLRLWQEGKTGFPIIDAGMRELWHTGYMHNRARMIVASFLVKNLCIPWQLGAKWFWDCLLDADLANNSASWQWVAGSGADAAPYFRIFNPVIQSQKFDPDGNYIRSYVPELSSCPSKLIHDPGSASPTEIRKHGIILGKDYPLPIVDLKETRAAALTAYKNMEETILAA